jgi:hypothetical protein
MPGPNQRETQGQSWFRLTKEDWYFAIPTVLAVAAFFGLDWRAVREHVPPSDLRQVLTAVLAIASIVLSWRGWRIAKRKGVLRPATETIYGRTYHNESVEIDDKMFDHCRFENVTLIFRGTGIPAFNKVTVDGNIVLKSDHVAVRVFHEISGMISRFSGTKKFQSLVIDEHGNVTPIGPLVVKDDRPPGTKG